MDSGLYADHWQRRYASEHHETPLLLAPPTARENPAIFCSTLNARPRNKHSNMFSVPFVPDTVNVFGVEVPSFALAVFVGAGLLAMYGEWEHQHLVAANASVVSCCCLQDKNRSGLWLSTFEHPTFAVFVCVTVGCFAPESVGICL